jgi:hypothetical protein
MSIPDRDANSSDPVIQPYDSEDRSSANLFRMSAWLTWRLTDPDLTGDLRTLMELEAAETHALAELNQAVEQMPGETLTDKLEDPQQRATLRRLTLRWMRYQRALIDATTAHLDHAAPTNGH